MPVCALILLALVCPIYLNLSIGFWLSLQMFSHYHSFGSYFVVVVVGLFFSRCFGAESVTAAPLYGYFVVRGIFASSLVNTWPLAEFLADTLSLLALSSPV